MARWMDSALEPLYNGADVGKDVIPVAVQDDVITNVQETVPVDVSSESQSMSVNVDTAEPVINDAMMESMKIQLSNGLEQYFVAMANGQPVTDNMINRLYLQSQFVDGAITGEQYTKSLSDIGNNLYADADDAAAWIASVSRDNNPWHYEPVKTGRTYGSIEADEANISDVSVDVGMSGLGIDTALSQEQLDLINKLNGTGKKQLSSEEATMLYAQLVSDNYSKNVDVTDKCDGNVTKLPQEVIDGTSGNLVIDDGQGVMLDVSEMSVGRKTKLDGKVKNAEIDGKTAEEYVKEQYEAKLKELEDSDQSTEDLEENGLSIEVCGGTLTYKKAGSIAGVSMDDFHFQSDYLGDFHYNPSYFHLAYKTGETTVNGEKQEIAVPILHAENFDYDNAKNTGFQTGKEGAGSPKCPPKGLKVADYMYDGCTKMTRMPPLPDGLVSAHGMFNGCSGMLMAGHDAKEGEDSGFEVWDLDGNYGRGGTMNSMPKSLEDVSYMFADCEKMEDAFPKMGTNVWDARGMYQGCENIDKVIDMSNCKFLLTEMAADMYTGGNTGLQKKVSEYIEQNNGSISEWTGDGVKNHLNDRIQNGVNVTDQKWTAWQRMVDAQKLIEAEDPTGAGATTGLEALTAGLASYGVQRTADGNCYADDSTWATLREDYKPENQKASDGKEFLDKGLAFAGTFVVSSGILSLTTRSKWVGLLGGAAIATIPQVIGVGNKISPFLKTVSGIVGQDSVVGKGLNGLAEKLDSSSSDDKVSDVLSVEDLFDNRQTETKKYTEATLMTLTNTETNSKVGAGFYMKQIATMQENGRLLAQDGNLDVIAYTSEEEYETSCNSAVMSTACDGMMAHIDELAGENGTLTDAQKQEMGDAFIVMMQNIKSYSNGAMNEIKTNSDPEKMNRMEAGLGKVMRNTTDPLYSMMCQADAKYGILTDEQKKTLDSMSPVGTTTFSEYQDSFDMDTKIGDIGTPAIDVYVSQFQSGVREAEKAEKQAVEAGQSKSDINKLRMQYLEQNYGWMMDLAEEHTVKYSTDLESDVDTVETEEKEPELAE